MPSFKPLYLLDIDSNSFVNVTFGLGAYKKLVRLQQKDKNESNQTTVEKLNRLYQLCLDKNLPCYRVDKDYESWSLRREKINIAHHLA